MSDEEDMFMALVAVPFGNWDVKPCYKPLFFFLEGRQLYVCQFSCAQFLIVNVQYR
jgi:hypothetical protein